ncbi:hypothetical protein P9775_006615 [Pseudomonas aeruginosa]|uniref:hypothetical protein n=1 Tax=Pseudomonas aeruginosa TaxID=287 RepID=UPI0005B988BA|nr:hypothetical protein [Pseudomonas aeruginosa]EKW1691501.1 hypothetical protein [Pseudomonas aeruginosa]MBP5960471.1 hypothetical protein [Pseudomonas aeruginosa]MDE5271675.1 hypothetical protein [Pseudomonas aeruginosa]MDE5284262.1 hypothetical protein [Pseudomonas aeruginosa]WRS36150.1 hypothetical protein U9S62_08900 [Pseudomonas aeruginosa]
MEQAMRQEFEDRFPIPEGIEWRDTDYFPVQTDNVHVYVALAGVAARYTSMWQAWQASRAALRVELPEKMEPTRNIYGNLIIGSYNAVLDAVKEALQQAGIKVK